MKAVMMIAGAGTRLKPLTDYVPKCCVPIAGEPLLYIWLRKLKEFGIEHLLLNPSYGAQYIQKAILKAPVAIKNVTLRPEKEPIGTAQTLLRNRDWIGEDDFLIIYGDVLTDLCLDCLCAEDGNKDPLVILATYKTDKPKEKGIIAIDEKGWITDFTEKPENPQSDLAWAGIAWAQNRLLKWIPDDAVDLAGDVFTLDHIISTCLVHHKESAYFQDIGTIPNYLKAQTEWKKG